MCLPSKRARRSPPFGRSHLFPPFRGRDALPAGSREEDGGVLLLLPFDSKVGVPQILEHHAMGVEKGAVQRNGRTHHLCKGRRLSVKQW